MSWHRVRGSSTARGYGAAWQRLRVAIIQRDRGLCTVCRASGRVTAGRDVDHITPKARGGTDDPGNLRLLCKRCHADATARMHGAERGTWAGCDASGVPMRADHHWRDASKNRRDRAAGGGSKV